jgi:hypothetical protein
MEPVMARQLTVVAVTLEDREDGGLRVHSEVLPGLILSGADKEAVCDSIGPAIKAIFEHKGYKIVGVYPDQPIPDVMKLPSPRTAGMHVQQQFVGG